MRLRRGLAKEQMKTQDCWRDLSADEVRKMAPAPPFSHYIGGILRTFSAKTSLLKINNLVR
jgi:hypothetical protein